MKKMLLQKKLQKKILSCIVFLGVLVFPIHSFALSLDEAKASGVVGEKLNGYLGVVSSNPQGEKLVSEINAQRRAKYEEIANKNGTARDVVESLAAKKAIEKTLPGQWIEVSPGKWKKK